MKKIQNIVYIWLHTINFPFTAKNLFALPNFFNYVVIILLSALAPGVNEQVCNLIWYPLILVRFPGTWKASNFTLGIFGIVFLLSGKYKSFLLGGSRSGSQTKILVSLLNNVWVVRKGTNITPSAFNLFSKQVE